MLSPSFKISRRELIAEGSKLSVASLALLTGLNIKALAAESQASTTAQDIDILNEILGTEYEGIAAYQVCFDSNLLQKDTAKTALIFQDHHKQHRDLLTQKISTLGGTPAPAKKQDEYKDDLNLVTAKTQSDALHLIVRLELSAANAYIGMLPSTNDHELAKMAGRIAADEVIHWTTLSGLLGLPVPTQAFSIGA